MNSQAPPNFSEVQVSFNVSKKKSVGWLLRKPDLNCNFSKIQDLNLKCCRWVFSQECWNFLRIQNGSFWKTPPSATPPLGTWESPSVSPPLQSLSGGQKKLTWIYQHLSETISKLFFPHLVLNSLGHKEGRPHLEETFKSEVGHQVTGVWVILGKDRLILSALKAS